MSEQEPWDARQLASGAWVLMKRTRAGWDEALSNVFPVTNGAGARIAERILNDLEATVVRLAAQAERGALADEALEKLRDSLPKCQQCAQQPTRVLIDLSGNRELRCDEHRDHPVYHGRRNLQPYTKDEAAWSLISRYDALTSTPDASKEGNVPVKAEER